MIIRAIDLVSSDDSETDSLVSSDYDTQEDNYFQDNDDDNGVNLVIKRFLAALAAKAAVESLLILQFFSSTSYKNKQDEDDNKDDNKDNNEDDNEDNNENNNENDNEGMTKKEKNC
ncbi:21531_t:CDS:2 [Gigaspora margarita]|uniref:21531_t:CDS:1 n=1 Tax=Gigaspora margarita TaxID=4874 RepID=A0ABN7VBV9_GIGMA|nr:21531_t:CDS:2 [Gigaspora margarita]